MYLAGHLGIGDRERLDRNNCTDCILDLTDACTRGAGRATDDEICNSFISRLTYEVNKNESWQLGYEQGREDLIAELKEHFSFKNVVIDEPVEIANIRGGRFYIDITSALNRFLYDYLEHFKPQE